MITYSPYLTFTKEEWSKLKLNVPMTLSQSDIKKYQGINEKLTMEEVSDIYLPLSRLLNLFTTSSQQLHSVTDTFLGESTKKVPYIIGVAGSVAAGKSTISRIIQALLSNWPNHPNVEILTTDGFLYPNAILKERGLMERKGFPESYNTRELINVLAQLKSGEQEVKAPVYSHVSYDVIPNEYKYFYQPDIVIVEGINVLQTPKTVGKYDQEVYVSDFFDLSIYVDADEDDLYTWYIERFRKLRDTSFKDPKSYFKRYANLTDEEANTVSTEIWNRINLVNLKENIKPTKNRADIILRKGHDHSVNQIHLRKM